MGELRQMLMARGAAADAEQVVAATPLDEWDRWNQTRDRLLTQSTSYRYAPGVYGAEDLDTYGNWQTVPEYGNV
jgi:hypothetical protein